MPQWSRDRVPDHAKYPDERWQAACPRQFAELLLRYDHHVVWIAGRSALLLTYAWATDAPGDWPTELPFEVSFTYAVRHPKAPGEVQRVVDQLRFARVASADRTKER